MSKREELRKVRVAGVHDDYVAFFHRFTSGGKAIVEMKDGKVMVVDAYKLLFLDVNTDKPLGYPSGEEFDLYGVRMVKFDRAMPTSNAIPKNSVYDLISPKFLKELEAMDIPKGSESAIAYFDLFGDK